MQPCLSQAWAKPPDGVCPLREVTGQATGRPAPCAAREALVTHGTSRQTARHIRAQLPGATSDVTREQRLSVCLSVDRGLAGATEAVAFWGFVSGTLAGPRRQAPRRVRVDAWGPRQARSVRKVNGLAWSRLR